jgi:hypothetical protein
MPQRPPSPTGPTSAGRAPTLDVEVAVVLHLRLWRDLHDLDLRRPALARGRAARGLVLLPRRAGAAREQQQRQRQRRGVPAARHPRAHACAGVSSGARGSVGSGRRRAAAAGRARAAPRPALLPPRAARLDSRPAARPDARRPRRGRNWTSKSADPLWCPPRGAGGPGWAGAVALIGWGGLGRKWGVYVGSAVHANGRKRGRAPPLGPRRGPAPPRRRVAPRRRCRQAGGVERRSAARSPRCAAAPPSPLARARKALSGAGRPHSPPAPARAGMAPPAPGRHCRRACTRALPPPPFPPPPPGAAAAGVPPAHASPPRRACGACTCIQACRVHAAPRGAGDRAACARPLTAPPPSPWPRRAARAELSTLLLSFPPTYRTIRPLPAMKICPSARGARPVARSRAVSVQAVKKASLARAVGRVAGAIVGIGLALVRSGPPRGVCRRRGRPGPPSRSPLRAGPGGAGAHSRRGARGHPTSPAGARAAAAAARQPEGGRGRRPPPPPRPAPHKHSPPPRRRRRRRRCPRPPSCPTALAAPARRCWTPSRRPALRSSKACSTASPLGCVAAVAEDGGETGRAAGAEGRRRWRGGAGLRCRHQGVPSRCHSRRRLLNPKTPVKPARRAPFACRRRMTRAASRSTRPSASP